MKTIPEKNLLRNRKSETAAALCLSWVISSLYSLIIDTALIRMTDPNVALCLCVFCWFGFFLLFKKIDFPCKQAACHLAGVFIFTRSRETSVKNRFRSPQSTQLNYKETKKQVLLWKKCGANSQQKHWFYCIFLGLNAAKITRRVPSFPRGISPPQEFLGRTAFLSSLCAFPKWSTF